MLSIVTVFDRAAQAYNRPMFVPHINVARRSFQDEINRAAVDNSLYQHPEDYELYELGIYDEATGRFQLLEEPRLVTRAQDLKDPIT